jgi:hypothetical protein
VELAGEVRALAREARRGFARLGFLEGEVTELRWQRHFAGRFGRLVRRSRLLTPRDLDRFEDADDAGAIEPGEADGVRQLDLIVEGVMGRGPDARNVLLAVEVSATVDRHDVERAIARAMTLRKVGYDAVPAVAGARMDATLRDEAVKRGVEVFLRPEDLPEIEP